MSTHAAHGVVVRLVDGECVSAGDLDWSDVFRAWDRFRALAHQAGERVARQLGIDFAELLDREEIGGSLELAWRALAQESRRRRA